MVEDDHAVRGLVVEVLKEYHYRVLEAENADDALKVWARHSAEIDLMLDTFPQNGGITTLDALLMGVPVVTLLGERVPGRASASMLTTLGLSDLVSPLRLRGMAAMLARIKHQIRERHG